MPTANFGLPLYTTSDTSALDTLLNGQSNAIDAALAANSNRLIGLDSARTALAAPKRKEGLQWFSTDTDIEWEFDGTNWVTNENGIYLIRPTSVAGATLAADGTIIPSNSTTVSVNGVFSTRYRKYRVEHYMVCSAGANVNARLRNAGADDSTAQYILVVTEASGSSVTAGTATGQNLFPLNYGNAVNTVHWGLVDFVNPGIAGAMKGFNTTTHSARNNNPGIATRSGRHETADANTYDGFSLFTNSAATFTTASWIKVYGLA